MELARSWFTAAAPAVPGEMRQLLATHPLTQEAVFTDGWPELKTRLPFPGEGRNHDLVLVGKAAGGTILCSVEGKVDETMGPEIGAYWRKSKRAGSSRAWRRIDALLASAFGVDARATEPPRSTLPYQLLTALVGTAIEASNRSCALGVLCVHEFVTESAKPELVEKNARDYGAFMEALGVAKSTTGVLSGPFDIRIPGSPTVIPTFVGKAQFRWAR